MYLKGRGDPLVLIKRTFISEGFSRDTIGLHHRLSCPSHNVLV
jgi:hypothetical protein